ncbi:hypothetical protein Tco_0796768 [Tanacetum coccineum]
MFKVFNRSLTTRTSRHDQTKINILQLFHAMVNRTNVDYAALLWWDFMNNVFQKKDVIQYPRFTKLIIAELMKKYPSISLRFEEDYHSIKVDIPLVSFYTTRNVIVQGMLILDTFLTEEIWKKRKQSAEETSSPQKSLKVTIKLNLVVKGEKDVESYADKFTASMIHDDVDDSNNRIKHGSHKEHPKLVDDNDDIKEEKKDDEIVSLGIRTEKL